MSSISQREDIYDQYDRVAVKDDDDLHGHYVSFVIALLIFAVSHPFILAWNTIRGRPLVIAGLRAVLSAVIISISLLIPWQLLSTVVLFAGKMFAFLAVYGLIVPVENAIVGGAADFLMGKNDVSDR